MRVLREPIKAVRVIKNHYNNGVKRLCLLEQKVTEIYQYPKKSTLLSKNLFSDSELGKYEEKKYNKLFTVLIEMPDNVSIIDIQARLDAHPKANIFKVLSNHPILNRNEKEMLLKGILEYDDKAMKQIIRYRNGRGLILDRYGKPQYFSTYLSLSGQENIDIRTSIPTDYYIPKALEKEFYSVKPSVVVL